VIDILKLSNKYYNVACSVDDDNIIKYFKIFICIFILWYTFNFMLLILELIALTAVSKLVSETCLIISFCSFIYTHKILL
jgi:hypothetical protein